MIFVNSVVVIISHVSSLVYEVLQAINFIAAGSGQLQRSLALIFDDLLPQPLACQLSRIYCESDGFSTILTVSRTHKLISRVVVSA